MRIKYFPDTDTALLELTDYEVVETRQIGENIFIDVDRNGNLVSMTIEHAKANTPTWEFSYREMIPESA